MIKTKRSVRKDFPKGTSKSAYEILCQRLTETSHLNSTLALLQWDQEVFMPFKAGAGRSKTISYLSVLAHDQLLALDKDKLLTKLHGWARTHLDEPESIVVREAWRAYDRERKLPTAFVQELSELCSVSQSVWAEARKKDDFSLFLPKLKRMVELKRQEAEYIGYKKSPYDALLDVYEPGLTSDKVTVIFNELRDFLKDFVKTIQSEKKQSSSDTLFKGTFPIEQQHLFNQAMAQKIGFDLEAGRLDKSTHPFTTSFHPQDVRLTTRYDETDLLYALGSTIHEMGHGLYEQGLPIEHFGTPLGETVSLGIHESQSRLWENMIGKSQAFWQYFYPVLQKQFPKPYAKISFDTFYRHINQVKPSLIRTESDEVTYNLHIILRYEIEKGLIEGSLRAKDLPEVWKAKMKEYLGVTVPNDRVGALQDVHWSSGAIGYFPTYAMGNLYAAQFYRAAQEQLPNLAADLARGNFKPFLDWLRKNIHAHGKLLTADALVEHVSGEPLQITYFTQYLLDKYRPLAR